MRVKPPKPFNITNPIEHHTARLVHGQQVRVLLENPTVLREPADSEWVLETDSRFFNIVSDQQVTGGHQTKYREVIFDQINVKHKWEFASNLFLGNIQVSLRGVKSGPKHMATIYAFLNCKSEAKEDLVTVIDPVSTKTSRQFVKMDPRQVLEVVVPDTSEKMMHWKPYLFPVGLDDLMLELIFHEYLPAGDEYGSFSYNPGKPFACERRIYDDNFKMPEGGEHHFFFRFAGLSSKLINRLENGVHPACRINFVGKDSDTQQVLDRRMMVGLSLRSAVRSREEKMGNAPLSKPKTFHPCDRIFDESHRTLVNPQKSEQVYMEGDGDTFIIEIAKPSVYFNRTGLHNAEWTAEVRSIHVRDHRSRCIKVSNHSPKWINQIPFQRFKIELEGCPMVKDELIVGEVTLTCNEIKSIVTQPTRSIYILLKKNFRVPKVPVADANWRTVACGDSQYKVHKRSSDKSPCGPTHHYSRSGYEDSIGQVVQVQSRKKGKNKNRYAATSHELAYFQVSLVEQPGDLTKGESCEYVSFPKGGRRQCQASYYPGMVANPHDPDSEYYKHIGIGQGPELRELTEFDKKKRESGNAEPPIERSNGGLSLSSRMMTRSKGKSASEATSVASKDMLTPVAKPPQEIYGLRERQTIVMEQAQPLIINVLLPQGTLSSESGLIRKQWTPNIVNTMAREGFILWINSCRIVESDETGFVHERIEIFPLVPRSVKPGRYRVGSLKLDGGEGVKPKIVKVELDVKGGVREPFRWWKDYWTCLKQSRPLSFGKFSDARTCDVENRTTLIDPVGETIDVPISKKSHEIEIILNLPQHPGEFKEEWSLNARMLSGKIDCLDQTIYKLYDGTPIYRALYRISHTDEKMYGEIKIKWDGKDTNTRICPYWEEKEPKKTEARLLTKVKIANDKADPTRVKFENWKDGDYITVAPSEQPHIIVPETANLIADRLQFSAKHAPWKIEIKERPLHESVWYKMPIDIRENVGTTRPYYGSCGPFISGAEPWRSKELVLRSLEKTQPFIYEFLKALRETYGKQISFPIADIVFTHTINHEFKLQRTLTLCVADPSFVPPKSKGVLLNDPKHGERITIEHGQVLGVTMPFRWKANHATMDFVGWKCIELPSWLVRLDVEDGDGDFETFNFIAEMPPGTHKSTGKLVFRTDYEYRAFKVIGLNKSKK